MIAIGDVLTPTIIAPALRVAGPPFALRSGIRIFVYAYGELPNEMALVPAEVIALEETNALTPCT